MKKIFLISLLSLLQFNILAQNKWQSFKKLSSPEKRWVLFHPFVASKAYNISKEAKQLSDSLTKDTILDCDPNGGQVDAFRHAYWMARLTQEIGWHKAKSLGKAHEKGNYIQFLKGNKEDGGLPDKVASDMDFLNNDIGIGIGLDYKKVPPDSLKKIIISRILNGEMWIILKNKEGKYIDCDGNTIQDSLLIGKWNTPKCLAKSNKVKKKRCPR